MSRRALLVGVQTSLAAMLRGPENDVEAMRSVLMTPRFGFEVAMLHDPNKKRADILAALEQLVAGAGAGDSLLFYYSGHGTQVTVQDRAEVECEAIVPSDYDDGQDHLLIKEFELHDLLRPAIDRGAKVTAILDCCFSGGMPPIDVLRRLIQKGGDSVRDGLEAVPGELVEDLGLIGIRAIPRRSAPLGSALRSMTDAPSAFVRSMRNGAANPTFVFAACGAAEIATERGFNKVYMGVFTHYLVRVLRDLAPDATNIGVRDAVRAMLRETTTKQNPIAHPIEPDSIFLV